MRHTHSGKAITPMPMFVMHQTRGKNLIRVGFSGVTLRCMFPHGQYDYEGVPVAEFDKLKRSPFPDRLFNTNIKGKYPCKKVGA